MSPRAAVTLAPILDGQRVHVGLTYDAAGRLVDVRVDQHRVGSYGRETHTALAALVSLALRHGVTPGEIGAELRGTEGHTGPGVVRDLDGVERASSVVDMLGQILVLGAP